MSKHQSWVVRPHPHPSASIRLFCFPRAGGGVSSFRGWSADGHPDMEITFIQLPGRETRLREEPVTSMPDLVASIADDIGPSLDKPYAFFGHSLGAKIAFEAARELRRRNLAEPAHLFVAASAAPSVPWNHPSLHSLDDLSLLHAINQRYGGVPEEIFQHRDLYALLVPALRADMKIIETYRYVNETPLSIPVTCFCGTDDPMTPQHEALEWQQHTTSVFRLDMLPGDHFFPTQLRSSILATIAAELNLQHTA